MASQTDKKEEFRKYLEKSNVLATLTNILTDLFEMDSKPEDPGQYLYQKFGESLKKSTAPPSEPNHDQQEAPPRDTAMTDGTPNAALEVRNASNPTQDLPPPAPATSKPDAVQSVPGTLPAEAEAVSSEINPSAQAQTHVAASVPVTASETPATAAKETTIATDEANSITGSALPNPSGSQPQPSDTAMPPAGSPGPSGGVPVANNTAGPSPAPASVQ